MGEVTQAALLWPIWLRVGLQDIRMKYQRSTLGFLWIFLNLAIMILAVGVIYSNLLGQDLKNFLPFLTIGLITWGYLTSSVVEGGNAFVISEGYIKQIGLPLYIYVFRFFVGTTATMLISLPAFFVVAIIFAVPFHWGVLWGFVGLLLLSVLSFLLIAIFSHLNARFRDVAHIASLGLQVIFFVTPVIWPPEIILNRGRLSWILFFNPFYHILEIIRRPLLTSEAAPFIHYLVAIALILMLSLIAGVVTKCYSQRIAYWL